MNEKNISFNKNINTYLERINYNGDFSDIVSIVCKDYNIGSCVSYGIVTMGYEDLNVIIQTNKGKYFAKFFASDRDAKECKRYVDVMLKVLAAGVSHPKLYKSQQGYLHTIKIGLNTVRLCLMEYIEGKTFYELGINPTSSEIKFLANQAAVINQIAFKPKFIYDQWAIMNFRKEYGKKGKYLSDVDKELVYPLYEKFLKFNADELPHCFVHGDILKTNVLKASDGRLYILDFAVSNYYPRIVELSVFFCFFLNKKGFPKTEKMFKVALAEYRKTIKLTAAEIAALPFFLDLAHAMHILEANYQKIVKNNMSAENNYWLELGRIGLKHQIKIT